MQFYLIETSWEESGHDILKLIDPFRTNENCAILYNGDPGIKSVYIASTERRIIQVLESAFTMKEIESIDYSKDLMFSSNRQWGLKGNPDLVNF